MTETTAAKPLAVEYFHAMTGGKANIMWRQVHRMSGGKFPPSHPIGGGNAGNMQFGQSDAMTAFRALGYWASCFPGGDGIVLDLPEGKDAAAVARDIQETFGWNVKVKRS